MSPRFDVLFTIEADGDDPAGAVEAVMQMLEPLVRRENVRLVYRGRPVMIQPWKRGRRQEGEAMTTEFCTDQIERCTCARTKDHTMPHTCECGAMWDESGAAQALPPEGSQHCCAHHAEHPTTV